ncbi:MAG: NAD(P)-dependent oxidoreductase, partial [Leptolyngbyaceae bacterium]|nr:NAD(P)-dependent oxidoreductase [Leptolyngbyaceae bacterium]
AVRTGKWLKIQGTSLRGKTAGIIGVGSIGQAIARRMHVLGMNLLGYDVRPIAPEFCQEVGLKQVELSELFQQSNCILLACNLTPENHHLLDRNAFNQMQEGTWIVNVARGPIIDELALVDALKQGKVGAAALDVFESEPLAADNPLAQFEQVICGSHNSSNTKEAVLRVNQLAINNLVRDLNQATGASA